MLRPRLDGGRPRDVSIPAVAWRSGIDRRPVDVTDDDEVRWLRSCIWPEQQWRTELLERAVARARRDPPIVVRGDVVEALPAVVREAPPDTALCIVHTAVLGYVTDGEAPRAISRALSHGAWIEWLS